MRRGRGPCGIIRRCLEENWAARPFTLDEAHGPTRERVEKEGIYITDREHRQFLRVALASMKQRGEAERIGKCLWRVIPSGKQRRAGNVDQKEKPRRPRAPVAPRQLWRIAWRTRRTDRWGHGDPVYRRKSQAKNRAEELNLFHPGIEHWAETVEIPPGPGKKSQRKGQ